MLSVPASMYMFSLVESQWAVFPPPRVSAKHSLHILLPESVSVDSGGETGDCVLQYSTVIRPRGHTPNKCQPNLGNKLKATSTWESTCGEWWRDYSLKFNQRQGLWRGSQSVCLETSEVTVRANIPRTRIATSVVLPVRRIRNSLCSALLVGHRKKNKKLRATKAAVFLRTRPTSSLEKRWLGWVTYLVKFEPINALVWSRKFKLKEGVDFSPPEGLVKFGVCAQCN